MALRGIDRKDVFFENILRTFLKDSTIHEVVLVGMSSATSMGQNFFSTMTRLQLKYTCVNQMDDWCNEQIEKMIYFIIKEEPTDILSLQMARSMNLFHTELAIFENVLPKIEKLVDVKIGPKFIYGSHERSQIIMEDLCVLGYENTNLHLEYSEAQTLMVIEKLAKFHAGSVAFNEKQPGYLQHFKSTFITDSTHANYLKMLQSFTRSLGEIIRNWSNEKCAKAAPKFERLATVIVERLRHITSYSADEFCVLNHGDCWFNNIMFRENALNEPQDVRLVDFQMSVWSSPAMDLIYFLTVCPQVAIRISHHDIFLSHYLTTLGQTMRSLGCNQKIPTLKQLKESMKKRGTFAVNCGIIFWSKIAASAEGTIETISDILEKGCSDMTMFNRPKIVEAMSKIIPWMNEMGYLD